jgi:hypothetical protein
MYAMNIQNDVVGLVLRQNCKLKQVTDFIAWPSRCHDIICNGYLSMVNMMLIKHCYFNDNVLLLKFIDVHQTFDVL